MFLAGVRRTSRNSTVLFSFSIQFNSLSKALLAGVPALPAANSGNLSLGQIVPAMHQVTRLGYEASLDRAGWSASQRRPGVCPGIADRTKCKYPVHY